MRKLSIAGLLFSGILFVVVFVLRLVFAGWENFMWVPLGLSLVLLVCSLILEWKFLLEFFTMKTTKHGMNMGAMIVLAVVLIGAINFIVLKNEKKFDFTSEGLNSLAEQSVKVVKNIKSDIEVVLLYKKSQQVNENSTKSIADLVQLYKNETTKIKYSSYEVLKRPDLAKQFEFNNGELGVFVSNGQRHLRIDQPNEEEFTKALIKLSRETKKTIYFTTGHGERELEDKKPESISDFKTELDTTLDVKTLSLVKDGKVPDDAAIVAIIGPTQQFLEAEFQALRNFAYKGGKFIIAADPATKTNIANLTKTFGIEFQNNYVLDPRAQMPGAGNIAALGTVFSPQSSITKSLSNGGMFSVFLLSSSLKKDPNTVFTIEELVKTDERAFAVPEISQNIKYQPNGPHTLVMEAKGTLPKSKDEKLGEPKEFNALVFGDSDFVSNGLFRNNLNRDLMMNAIASVSDDQELISIRPKAPKGTKIEITATQLRIFFFGFIIPLPIILFITSGIVFFRRRVA